MKILNVILISSNPESLNVLEQSLAAHERFIVARQTSPEQVFSAIENGQVDVVIADDQVDGTTGLEFLRELVKRSPFVNCALVSSLYPGEFHEATEGLGVFMQLPLSPGPQAARDICAHLEKIYRFDSL